mmetsp:Transcript_57325/g.121639  ORF Transcript_57325/g.121639 Transcript_57325/m.121639 type:complete len:325 (-) Transcript_57325:340-1314(-)|eukprot:CAMPEP_0172555020 /NCGR_PEP_ID=MMETSP1067-20121228/57610_1 /TAXON_ID=265564 ORGANISM="Thalassiosira punctigera, Strain Tpunct2005C2" /NCGR_SAMPLE_ID=MMETSP1067 /ASSEMBLY_ACC=CAM_ASM_000444 /LENGTH=324 /DNA_ID=CAMNT_0013343519 /DNA_START=209 /DNA_END=1183 /DNA_ORIENTATION=+
MRPAQSLLALWAAATAPGAQALTPSARSSSRVAARPFARTTSSTSLNLKDPEPGTKLVSNRKEIAYDGVRFFETGVDEEDCIPAQEFCVIDPDTSKPIRLTVEEKERMFLDSLQSYYVSGRQVMDDAEFDALKEDLAWSGSEVVNLNRKEIQYLEAMQAYNKGESIMTDADFDRLRDELREDGSAIAVSKEPKCYIDTGICTATFQKDNFRNNLLYLPALSIIGLLWLGIGFEIVGGRINPLVLGAFGAPVVGSAAKAVTDQFIFPNNLVAYGPCPSCEAENRVYFGDILGVEGFGKQGAFKCTKCKEQIIVQRRSLRANTLPK